MVAQTPAVSGELTDFSLSMMVTAAPLRAHSNVPSRQV